MSPRDHGTLFLLLLALLVLFGWMTPISSPQTVSEVSAPFIYSFNAPGVLQEASSARESSSPYWFLDSGGVLTISDGQGATIQGALPVNDRWRRAYAASNPLDTDNGAHPQNLFRLLTKGSWENADMEVEFMITADNLSASENRNESNGVFLMSRYRDQDTLYYAGIRVDGTAVIKKKYQGTYSTLAQEPLFSGTYSAATPDLLPHKEWLSLRSVVETRADGTVSVSLYLGQKGELWRPVARATDTALPITGSGVSGIRSDFVDLVFKNVRITPL